MTFVKTSCRSYKHHLRAILKDSFYVRRVNILQSTLIEIFKFFILNSNLNAKLNEVKMALNGAKIKETMCPIIGVIQCFGIIYAFNSTQVKCDVGLNVESLIELSTGSVEDSTSQIE